MLGSLQSSLVKLTTRILLAAVLFCLAGTVTLAQDSGSENTETRPRRVVDATAQPGTQLQTRQTSRQASPLSDAAEPAPLQVAYALYDRSITFAPQPVVVDAPEVAREEQEQFGKDVSETLQGFPGVAAVSPAMPNDAGDLWIVQVTPKTGPASDQTRDLVTGLRDNTLSSILFPTNIIANADRILSDLREVFPPQADRFVFGPMAKITWGTPTLLTADIGLVLEVPEPVRLLILGVVRGILPDETAAILRLQVNFLGVIDFEQERFSFDASLFAAIKKDVDSPASSSKCCRRD